MNITTNIFLYKLIDKRKVFYYTIRMIISFVSTKGGQGKSTLSLCVSYSKIFNKSFDSIGLVEMDVQGTLRTWYVCRSENEGRIENDKVSYSELIGKNDTAIKSTLNETINRNEGVILDVGGTGRPTKYLQMNYRYTLEENLMSTDCLDSMLLKRFFFRITKKNAH